MSELARNAELMRLEPGLVGKCTYTALGLWRWRKMPCAWLRPILLPIRLIVVPSCGCRIKSRYDFRAAPIFRACLHKSAIA